MNEIMKKTYELIDAMEESEMIRNIEKYRERIMDDPEVNSLIKQGKEEEDEYIILEVKKKLYQNKNYQGYMENYNQLMYLVMDINYRYKKLLGKGSCHR